jgi:hypothetical protein
MHITGVWSQSSHSEKKFTNLPYFDQTSKVEVREQLSQVLAWWVDSVQNPIMITITHSGSTF